MHRIRNALIAFSLLVTLVWLFTGYASLTLSDSHKLGTAFTQYSGILSIAMMAFANLLAIRPKWMEPMLDGLDKMYRLHKWLGIGALAIGVVHWLTATGDGHGPGGPDGPDAGTTAAAETTASSGNGFLDWLATQHGTAHGVAQPALFVLIALIAVALIKKVPYRIFAKTHIIVVLVFLVLAYHSLALMQVSYWAAPIGWLTAALIAVGTVCALISLVRYTGVGRSARAKVLSATYYPELHVIETELLVNGKWRGHQPGQFAFVTTDWVEGPHPFTIATAWSAKDRRIGFIAKELGDHTAKLREHFQKGRRVLLEGPFGQFTFDDAKPRQIWVGGGIGIRPFVAKMRELAKVSGTKKIDLFHTTTDVSEVALDRMRADAERAGVTLHILISPRDGRLDAAKIMELVPDWANASVWFCGPTGFGDSLWKGLTTAGLSAHDFHQELFEMR